MKKRISQAKTFSLVPFIRIDTSGQDGDNGRLGGAASHLEAKGFNGTDGMPGKNARAINLRLKKQNELVAAEWDDGSGTLKLGDNTTSFVLRAVGGRGGRGGDAGRGGAGTQGAHGADATRYSNGENGKRVSYGGVGGNSGHGADGGSGGAVKVSVSPDGTRFAPAYEYPGCIRWFQGERRGQWAKGAVGGTRHRWAGVIRGMKQCTGLGTVSDGRGGTRSETYAYTVTRTNPGGNQGHGRDILVKTAAWVMMERRASMALFKWLLRIRFIKGFMTWRLAFR